MASALGIDQYSRIKDAVRIELSFRRPKRRRKEFRTLTIVPVSMIAADGVVMRDRASGLDKRIAGRVLERLPLLPKRAVAAQRME